MKTTLFKSFAWLALSLALAACSDDDLAQGGENSSGKQLISLNGEIDQIAVTRVNDNGFCDGDVIGVYIVDYQGGTPGTLKNSGNRGDNVRHTFDEANYKWSSAYDVYWKDKNTHIDVYGYYPWGSPTNVSAYEFEVQKDQSRDASDGEMGGYEASDFLWGKVSDVAPTQNVIRLPMRHRMACAKITLVEGSGFESGEWTSLQKMVIVKNVKRNAYIDLATGEVTATGEVSANGTTPYQKEDYYRAIVVPQTVSAGTPLFSLTVGNKPYTFKKEESFSYVSGKMHNFSIRVDKKADTGDYTFSLAGESITAWENDDVSHDATMKEYVVIESEAGKLKEAILAANKDYRKLKNLKITGEINALDFYFMRDSMDVLQALNLKEVRIKGSDPEPIYMIDNKDDQIPNSAFFYNNSMSGKASLTRLVLPDILTSIGARAFFGCKNLSGSLVIPEGVVDIQQSAFAHCTSLTGTLSLPSTLKYLGNAGNGEDTEIKDEGIDYYGGVFSDCGFVCELQLPDGLELIRGYCFSYCTGLYGELRLPEKLRRLGLCAFSNCRNLTGSLTIPQQITDIPSEAFHNCGFNGNLQLHDGITTIANDAFCGCHFKGELKLPKNLAVIADRVFAGCDFSGELKLPSGLTTIGANAFGNYYEGANWRLMGVLEIPDGVTSIGEGAFYNCRGLEGVVFPESLESIRNEAFFQCYGLGSIVSKSSIPPVIMGNAFDGVPKDNFTLEVPESAIVHYQTATGWMDFKRIAAHHELVCRPSTANAINTEHKETLILNAEGEWEVESQPDWCTLSQTSGNSKTELTLTIHQMAAGSAPRTGKIVFKLKGKDYRHTCTVNQYDYTYAEDEIITLQKATKGNRGGINLVFLGDGFDGKDISEGKYMADMQMQVENFFGIEPFKTYRDYFNIHTAIALSPETGIGTVNSIRYAKFETTFAGGVGLKCDYDAVFRYALRIPEVTEDNLNETLIIIVPNSTDYGGICQMWESGAAIAFCPMSTYGYPLDTRGVIQHEAGGHGFGKLGDEYIYHNAFIDFCGCACCGHVMELNWFFSMGWFENLSLTGKMHEVPWSHLIFDERYSDIVDIFEGGYMHTRGVFRSEQNSCMNNDIPYYSTISRESIVKRIKRYAGEEYSFEEFVANDKRTAGAATRFEAPTFSGRTLHSYQLPPHVHKGSPLKK